MFAELREEVLDGAGHALFEGYGMSSVEHQKAADQRIMAEFGERSATGLAGVEQLDDAGDDGTVQVHHRLEEFERGGARIFVGEGGDVLHQLVNALGVRLELIGGGGHLPPARPNIGEWRACNTLPPPRYMCTPQGRHGSKLRTARMMSMPLKLSGPFSSKSGVFWTASS